MLDDIWASVCDRAGIPSIIFNCKTGDSSNKSIYYFNIRGYESGMYEYVQLLAMYIR